LHFQYRGNFADDMVKKQTVRSNSKIISL